MVDWLQPLQRSSSGSGLAGLLEPSPAGQLMWKQAVTGLRSLGLGLFVDLQLAQVVVVVEATDTVLHRLTT